MRQRLLLGLCVWLLLASPAAAQRFDVHRNLVQIRSTAVVALDVLGGGRFVGDVEVRSALDGISDGFRVTRADGSYLILNMDDGGSFAFGTIQAGDGAAYRQLRLSPLGGGAYVGHTLEAAGLYVRQNNVTDPGHLELGNGIADNGAAGRILWRERDSTAQYTWVDTTGVLRIHTAAPNSLSGASDTAGTVVGTQTSTWESKTIFGRETDTAWALAELLQTPVYRFEYKNGAYNHQQFVGITTRTSPLFGMDDGRVFNPVTGFGVTVLAIQELTQRVTALERGRP